MRSAFLPEKLPTETGNCVVVWPERKHKDSLLFIHLLYPPKHIYCQVRRIVLIVDNSIVHNSFITRRWVANNPMFELLFQPVYPPWAKGIEQLWKMVHDTATRCHRHRPMKGLMGSVQPLMQACQPRPGSAYAPTRALGRTDLRSPIWSILPCLYSSFASSIIIRANAVHVPTVARTLATGARNQTATRRLLMLLVEPGP